MRLAITLATLVLFALPLHAADWISLRSAHFQLYSNATARELRDVALRLEQFREVIARLQPANLRANAPAVIALIFRDDRSLRPFMPRANGRLVPVTGLFTGGPNTSYIALSLEAGEDAYPGIFHEFSHYLLGGGVAGVPVWLNEGLADYYSTFEVTNGGRSAQIGRPHERHIAMLRERRMPLTQLFGITHGSAEYTGDVSDRILMYAQSWLLVHHALQGEPRRWDQLVAFARRMAAGGELAASLLETYGMSVTELDRQLQAYVRRPVFQFTNIDFIENVPNRLAVQTAPADEADLDARLGGFAASMGNIDEASRRLEHALKAKPDAAHIHDSLGVVRLLQGRREEAAVHFQKSRELAGQPAPQFARETHLSESEARGMFPEGFAKLDANRPATNLAPAAPIEITPPREPRTRLLLSDLREGEQATLGTLEAIECRAAGVVVVLRTPDGVVRANAASFAAVNFVTFRSTTEGSIACGKQSPAPARLISRQDGVSRVAVALELLPDGYVP